MKGTIELTEIYEDTYKVFAIPPLFAKKYRIESHINKIQIKTDKIISCSERKVTNKKHPLFRKDYPKFTIIKVTGGNPICVVEDVPTINNLLE